jgi:uncharacterized RDD family membrane protein YckC
MGRRVVAYLIDLVIASAVLVALLAATKDRTYTGIPSDFNDACRFIREAPGFAGGQCLQLGSRAYTWTGGAFLLSWGLSALVGLINNVIVQAATGASVGKMVMGLRVIDAEGRHASIGRQFVRWLLLIVDAGLCFVGFFVAAFTHPHRRLGDMAGGTYVVAAADVGTPVSAMPQQEQYAQPAYVPPPPQPAWGQPPPPSWNQPQQPQQPQWGAPQQAPPPAQPQWGAPPPPQPQWGAPQQAPPPQQPPAWGQPQQPPAYERPPEQQRSAPQPPYEPPPAPPDPAPEPEVEAPPEPPPASNSSSGESWWDSALGDDADKRPQD